MKKAIVLSMLFMFFGMSACQKHVCEDEESHCIVDTVEVTPKRLALPSNPSSTPLVLQVQFGGDAFEKTIPALIRQARGTSFPVSLEQDKSDPHRYLVDLTPNISLLVPGQLTLELSKQLQSSIVLYESMPFSQLSQKAIDTTKYLSASYGMTIRSGTNPMNALSPKQLLIFGAIGTTPNYLKQNIEFDLDFTKSPLLKPAAIPISYPYSPHSGLWLGNALVTETDQKIWFYYARAEQANEYYRLIRCPESASKVDECSSNGGQTKVLAGIGGAGEDKFRLMTVDPSGRLVVLTNGKTQEAYEWKNDVFEKRFFPTGIRLQQLVAAYTNIEEILADKFPDVWAVDENNQLLLYVYDSATHSFQSPILMFDLKTIFPGENVTALAVGDINGDNTPDIVVSSNKWIRFLINTGLSSTGRPILEGTFYTLAGSNSLLIRSLILSDVDGDGFLDIISGNDAGLGDRITPQSTVEFFLTNRK